VVDVKAVAQPLLAANSCDGAIEAVAEPVREQRDGDRQRAPRAGPDPRESETGGAHREQSKQCQMIRAQPLWQPRGDCDQQPLFGGSKQASIFAGMGH
jgi:hypothetical protein